MINLIFDYDGTLHDSIQIYAPAFQFAYNHLVALGKASPKEWVENEISRWIGMSSKNMWNSFMPNLSQILKDECSNMIGNKMICLVNEGKAKLYPQALKTLSKLKSKGYNLIFLSNCKHSYMQAHIDFFLLDNYFSAFYSTEDFGFKPKYEIFNTIREKVTEEFIIVGDRFQDFEIALKNGFKSIGCKYGYGSNIELSNATMLVDKPIEILLALEDAKVD